MGKDNRGKEIDEREGLRCQVQQGEASFTFNLRLRLHFAFFDASVIGDEGGGRATKGPLRLLLHFSPDRRGTFVPPSVPPVV